VRHKACDLYEPSGTFRDLKLPVLQWGADTRWKPFSEEGSLIAMLSLRLSLIQYLAKFMYKLGLRRSPPLQDIIKLAAHSDADVRKKALLYFLDNFTSKYSDYDSRAYNDVAFIPATNQNGLLIAKPTEVSSSRKHRVGFNHHIARQFLLPRNG